MCRESACLSFRNGRFRSSRSSAACRDVEVDELLKVGFFQDCGHEFLACLAGYLEIEMFAEGATIVKEGERGHKLYYLLWGSVDILAGPDMKKVAALSSGNIFGEMALFSHCKRQATVRAKEFCDCRVIGMVTFQAMLHRFPAEHRLFKDLAAKRRKERSHAAESGPTRLPGLCPKDGMHGDAVRRRSKGRSGGRAWRLATNGATLQCYCSRDARDRPAERAVTLGAGCSDGASEDRRTAQLSTPPSTCSTVASSVPARATRARRDCSQCLRFANSRRPELPPAALPPCSMVNRLGAIRIALGATSIQSRPASSHSSVATPRTELPPSM